MEDGPGEHHREGERRHVQVQRHAELPGVGLQHVLDPDRSGAHLVRVQRDRDHDR